MKKMIFKLSTGALLMTILFSSCKKLIDDAYTNPNADTRRPVEELLPGIIANMTINASAQGSLYGQQNDLINLGRYIQYWATFNATGNQYERMGGTEITSTSSILGAHWAAHYYGAGENLNKMIAWGIEEEKWDYVGVGYAIRAWSWLSLTSLYGEVPLHTAWDNNRTAFPYDPQEEVYIEVRRLCHLALAYLDMTGPHVSQANLAKGDQYMNGGDVNKWKKFAYGVLARSFNHLVKKSNYEKDSVIYYCNLSLTSNADNTTMKFAASGVNHTFSYFSTFRGNFNTLRQGRFIANLMSGLNPRFPTAANDPRAPYMLQENKEVPAKYKGIRPNKAADGLDATTGPNNFYGGLWATTTAPSTDVDARYLWRNSAVFPIMTAAEIGFMKAEALYYKNDKVGSLAAYTQAINLHFDQLISDYEASVPAPLRMTGGTRAAYLADPNVIPVNPANLNLSRIMLQKYIAMYGFGGYETWVDLRKYHYNKDAEGTDTVYWKFEVPSSTDLWPTNNLQFVQRCFPRGASEYYNLPEFYKVGGSRLDYHTIEMWFSKP